MLYTERPLLELAGWGLLGVGWQAGLGGWPGRVGWLVRWGRVGVAGGEAMAGWVGWRVGWYGQATGNVHTARQGVCNCWVKNAL